MGEEERARQERQNAAANTDDSGGTTVAVEVSAAHGDSMEVDVEVEAATPIIATPVVTTASTAVDTVDEDALLQQALAMSMAEATGDTAVTATSMVEEEDDDDSMDEEMKMRFACLCRNNRQVPVRPEKLLVTLKKKRRMLP